QPLRTRLCRLEACCNPPALVRVSPNNQRVRSAMKDTNEQIETQPAAGRLAIEFDDIAAAAERLDGHAVRTPVLTSEALDARCGARVFFKCENLQHGGAFKFRGAFNALSQLSPAQRRRGVVAFSSGNHAIAVSLAAKRLGIPATIVMP